MSSIISEELQAFAKGKLGWVATSDPQGMPNATPKGTIRVLDGSTIVFADLFSNKTRENLEHNPSVAVTLVDHDKGVGYQFKGKAELVDAGPLFESVRAELKSSPKALPEPACVVKITVEAIYDQTPGPDAGKRIG